MESPKLIIKIENKQDIELFEFVSSIASLNEEYARFVAHKGGDFKNKCKLCIDKIIQGSIVIELIEKAPDVLPGITPVLVDYSVFLTGAFDYLSGKTKNLPSLFKYARETFLNFKKIMEVAANIKGNSINFNLNFGKTVINNSYTHTDANAIQNQCEKEIKRLDQSGESLIKEKVTLSLYQARDSVLSKSTRGNLGIIEEVSEKPKPISFSNDRLRYDITKAESNPLNFTYIVDTEVKLKEGSMFLDSYKDIKEYEILKLHGPVDKNELFKSKD